MSRKIAIIHDLRLGSNMRVGEAQRVFRVGRSTPIGGFLRNVATYAASDALDDLVIMCHGYESNIDQRNQMSVEGSRGGYGLMLCQEGINRGNVYLFAPLRDKIKVIILLACSIADTRPENRGTIYDGRLLCSEIASLTNAVVIASDRIQQFTTSNTLGDVLATWLMQQSANPYGSINFGNWEGNVYKFHPSGDIEQL